MLFLVVSLAVKPACPSCIDHSDLCWPVSQSGAGLGVPQRPALLTATTGSKGKKRDSTGAHRSQAPVQKRPARATIAGVAPGQHVWICESGEQPYLHPAADSAGARVTDAFQPVPSAHSRRFCATHEGTKLAVIAWPLSKMPAAAGRRVAVNHVSATDAITGSRLAVPRLRALSPV